MAQHHQRIKHRQHQYHGSVSSSDNRKQRRKSAWRQQATAACGEKHQLKAYQTRSSGVNEDVARRNGIRHQSMSSMAYMAASRRNDMGMKKHRQ